MANEDPQNYWKAPEDEQPNDASSEQNPPAYAENFTGVEETDQTDTSSSQEVAPVTWTAQEYIHLDRSPIWFVLFAVVVLVLIALDIFLLRSYTFSVLVVVMAVALVIYIRRPPRALTYALSPSQGLYIGERLYHLDDFKAFGLIQDGENHSIMLIPRKRFAPGVSVYFPQEVGEQIVDILGSRLPMENLKLDVVDLIVRKLRL